MLCKFGAVFPPSLNLSCLCHRGLSGATLLTMVSVPNKFFEDHKEMKEMLHPFFFCFFSFVFFFLLLTIKRTKLQIEVYMRRVCGTS